HASDRASAATDAHRSSPSPRATARPAARTPPASPARTRRPDARSRPHRATAPANPPETDHEYLKSPQSASRQRATRRANEQPKLISPPGLRLTARALGVVPRHLRGLRHAPQPGETLPRNPLSTPTPLGH